MRLTLRCPRLSGPEVTLSVDVPLAAICSWVVMRLGMRCRQARWNLGLQEH